MSLQPLVSLYQYSLTPLAPFVWLGLKVSSLDLVAAFRLCYVLRHLRQDLRDEHVGRCATAKGDAANTVPPAEDRSFARDALAVLTVVHGGEAIAASLLGVPAPFMISGVGPLLYIFALALVDALPSVPAMTPYSELALSFVDGHTRAVLVCTLVPRLVSSSAVPAVADSPWTLLLSSFIITNGGFFLANLVSLLQPTPLTLTTPAELLPYGWTGTDLWSAPLVTAIYATLTHAQPFWADLHAVLAGMLLGSGGGGGVEAVAAVDPETARSACALVLVALFANRAARKYALVGKQVGEKIKTN